MEIIESITILFISSQESIYFEKNDNFASVGNQNPLKNIASMHFQKYLCLFTLLHFKVWQSNVIYLGCIHKRKLMNKTAV